MNRRGFLKGAAAGAASLALGHSQVSVTLDTYSHVATSLQREAAVRVDELLGSATSSAF